MAEQTALPDQYLKTEDIAKMFQVSDLTVRPWNQSGQLPAAGKIGNNLFWHPDTVKDVLDKSLQK